MRRAGSWVVCLLLGFLIAVEGRAQERTGRAERVRLVPVGVGWARSSVNAPIFRQNSIVTHGDTQFTAYYDEDSRVILAKRRLGTGEWTVRRTPYTGNVRDAHNAISIGIDGSGVLHVSWDHHGQPLQYARSTQPLGLELTDRLPMTGDRESQVTYPQFYSLPDGDLLFLYRDGSSGSGDVLLNRYDLETRSWQIVQHPLIDGQGDRNAYTNQFVIDSQGGWHVSWTWRETPDVATNHDIMYAYSPDEGRTWQTSAGRPYTLPVTAENAEVVLPVAQGSELINQTSMAVDGAGRPIIATYWRPEGTDVPQYQLVWYDGAQWNVRQIGRRQLAFRLSGRGTRRIPMSRPLVLTGEDDEVFVVFRDFERGGGVTVAVSGGPDYAEWRFIDVDTQPVGLWEPTYDPVVWRRDRVLHLFHQRVGQGDGETLEDVPPQTVSILEWVPR